MSSATAVALGHAPHGLLDKATIIAKPGFNRWLVPPAALAIHLCIGMAYGFSVFWLPLSRAIGVAKPLACPESYGLLQALTATSCDWKITDLSVMFELFFVFLGGAAAIWGGWLERAGPRRAGVVAAFCWSGGLLISAAGVYVHQLWLLWLGSGVIGGIGLGLGYISPVSTLIKWFPDRRGMATGMAIMGFGGGAMIGAPLANILMNDFRTPASVGVWQTFVVLGAIYFVAMMAGAFGYRVPPAGWNPEGWRAQTNRRLITHGQVHLRDAHKTAQFWLIWAVLMLNVSAGIGVIAMASPMLQEVFGGALIGKPDVPFVGLDAAGKTAVATIGAAFTGLLSLFNIGGRFFWASLSDRIGRKATYATFFILGIALYAAAPWAAAIGSKAIFVLCFCVILSMYGGGFATVPAYLADIFGTQFVGAIHGRLLTAWSTAGIIGPVVVTQIREFEAAQGVTGTGLYSMTMYLLASFLVVGLICNLLVRPLSQRWFMSNEEVAAVQAASGEAAPSGMTFGIGRGGLTAPAALAWLAVGLPIAWGVWITLSKAYVLF
ncbi:MAG TPA: OFA family MFS transporter [Acidisphaera sp.]|nr:OFA family MFS transporter [Acidisphaera sp.]